MNLKGIAAVLYDAYNSHDLGTVASLYEIDGAHQDIAMGHQVVGGDAIAAGLKKFFAWFPDAKWEPLRQMCDADGSIVVTYRLTGTLQAQMGPVIPTGQKISLRGVHYFCGRTASLAVKTTGTRQRFRNNSTRHNGVIR
jgi:predicted ester cyclase